MSTSKGGKPLESFLKLRIDKKDMLVNEMGERPAQRALRGDTFFFVTVNR